MWMTPKKFFTSECKTWRYAGTSIPHWLKGAIEGLSPHVSQAALHRLPQTPTALNEPLRQRMSETQCFMEEVVHVLGRLCHAWSISPWDPTFPFTTVAHLQWINWVTMPMRPLVCSNTVFPIRQALFAVVSTALTPRNDTDHTQIWHAAKHNLIHTIMHSGLITNTSLTSIYKGVTNLKVPRVQAWWWSLGSGRQQRAVSILQDRVSRSGSLLMASHKMLSMWTHPAEKLCGSVAKVLSSCSSSMALAW